MILACPQNWVPVHVTVPFEMVAGLSFHWGSSFSTPAMKASAETTDEEKEKVKVEEDADQEAVAGISEPAHNQWEGRGVGAVRAGGN